MPRSRQRAAAMMEQKEYYYENLMDKTQIIINNLQERVAEITDTNITYSSNTTDPKYFNRRYSVYKCFRLLFRTFLNILTDQFTINQFICKGTIYFLYRHLHSLILFTFNIAKNKQVSSTAKFINI